MIDPMLLPVLLDPADDAPRLWYADWLDDRGDHDRAEFIRVQIELAGWRADDAEQSLSLDGISRHVQLRRRELFLHPRVLGKVKRQLASRKKDYHLFGGNRCRFARGFVSAISLTQADFLQHAETIFQRHPIEQVTLMDRDPEHTRFNLWRWWKGDALDLSNIPDSLFLLLPKPEYIGRRIYNFKTFASRQAAIAALSAACVALGRERAGLTAMMQQLQEATI